MSSPDQPTAAQASLDIGTADPSTRDVWGLPSKGLNGRPGEGCGEGEAVRR